MALFTHQEEDPATAERFLAVARNVDAAVAMSNTTGNILTTAQINHTVIMPGVELDRFVPKLKIAVVGRTYHTGRKGEALVNAVQDVPDIEWHFTGEGWPGRAERIADADLPAFYRSMDYILVPALNEGGPMCVLEALAAGVPVIGPDVGWVAEFPHIPFERGNPHSLREVLLSLRDKKYALRATVQDKTWDQWAEGHDRLFQALAQKHALSWTNMAPKVRRVRSVGLLSHGLESSVIGGPSVRIPKTAEIMKTRGIAARALRFPSARIGQVDLLHAYNIWPPVAAVQVARRAVRLGKPFVFSPILLDFSEAPLWQADVLWSFRKAGSAQEADFLMAAARERQLQRGDQINQLEPEPGYLDGFREIAELADAFVFLGERERNLAQRLLPSLPAVHEIIGNPVDADRFANGDPALFREKYGLDDYVLCVGRIEHRKNQLLLASALRETNIPLVLIGHSGDGEYFDLVKKFGGPNLIHIDRLEPGSDMLCSAIAGARVFTLPSWAEGAPLAALEAGAAGTRMVLSDRSSEVEYFGGYATYCNPADPASIRESILEAWEGRWEHENRRTLSDHVRQSFSWERHVDATINLYERVVERSSAQGVSAAVGKLMQQVPNSVAVPDAPLRVILDLTTMINNSNLRSGIVRVEASIAQALNATHGVNVRFIAWRSASFGFIEVPRIVIERGLLSQFIKMEGPEPFICEEGWTGARLLIVGSSWMQNTTYAESLITLAMTASLELSLLVHDLTPLLFPHWFPEGYSAPFVRNLATLMGKADRLLTYSNNTRVDLENMALDFDIDIAKVDRIFLADDIGMFTSELTERAEDIQKYFSRRPYVLAVGAIHARKNYGLLYDAWSLLADNMGDNCPHLIIAGGVSWNGADQARMIREDNKVKHLIHIVDNIDDSALDWLYRNCLFTVYPSLYEGWGLPVGESLGYGKICIASDRSSVPEIAPSLTDLINPLDRLGWAARIQHYASSKSARDVREAQIRDGYKVTTWSDTAITLKSALQSPRTLCRRDFYVLGDIILFSSDALASRYKAGGWFPAEAWGSWVGSKSARLSLTVTAPCDEDFILTVLAKYFSPAGRMNRCTVLVNGTSVAQWRFLGGSTQHAAAQNLVNTAVVPKALISGDGRIQIDLVTSDMYKVCDVSSSSKDTRVLGMGVVMVSLQRASQWRSMPDMLSTRPDVRTAIGAPGNVNLASLFRTSAIRPAFPAGRPILLGLRRFAPHITAGVSEGSSGICFNAGLMSIHTSIVNFNPVKPLTLSATFLAMVPEEDDIPVEIFVNRHWVGHWDIPTTGLSLHTVDIPSAVFCLSDPMEITFTAGATASKTAGLATIAPRIVEIRIDTDGTEAPRAFQLESDGNLNIGITPQGTMIDGLGGGWYEEEVGGVWSIGDLGEAHFALGPTLCTDDVLLIATQVLTTDVPEDAISIQIRETGQSRNMPVPAEPAVCKLDLVSLDIGQLIANGHRQMTLEFKRNTLTTPLLRLKSNDPRLLGIRLSEVQVRRLATLPENTILSTGAVDFEQVAILDGWHEVDPAVGRWSQREAAQLIMKLPAGTPDGSRLRLGVTRMVPLTGDNDSPVTILVNGLEAATIVAGDMELVQIEVPLARIPAEDRLLHITILAPDVLSPADLGVNPDTRPLGVLLNSIELMTAPIPAAQGDEEG